MKRKGFKVTELIVVIVVIAVLIVIMFPPVPHIGHNAYRAVCLSNLKQIGLAMTQYSQDYDNQMTPAWIGDADGSPANGSTFPGTSRWMDLVFPYIKSTEVYSCPESRENPFVPYTFAAHKEGGFCMNMTYFLKDRQGTPPSPVFDHGQLSRSVDDLLAPATTVWVTDSNAVNSSEFQVAWPDRAGQPTISPIGSMPWPHLAALAARHKNRVDTLFCDGHIKSLPLETLIQKAQKGPTAGSYRYFTVEND